MAYFFVKTKDIEFIKKYKNIKNKLKKNKKFFFFFLYFLNKKKKKKKKTKFDLSP